jgi:hypothetical protein
MNWLPRRFDSKLFEITTKDRVVRIELTEGGVRLEGPNGETHWDGWATVDDIASGLIEFSQVPPEEARSVADTAVRQWTEWLAERGDDRPVLAEAARNLLERYRGRFKERGGDLHVRAAKSSNLRTRTSSLELLADVQWEPSRRFDHAHAEVARRAWFSRRRSVVRSPVEAARVIEDRLDDWLDDWLRAQS